MNKKAITLIGLTAVLATAATFLLAAGPKDKEEGKFHLVYLVSTDKVEVGAKVYVEPLVLTDGRDIKPVYEYCQAVRRGIRDPRHRLIASPALALGRFCRNESFTINGKNMFTRHIDGSSLKLGDITFTAYITDDSTALQPFMSLTATSQIANVEGLRQTLHTQAGWRHYLMASSDDILHRVVPGESYQPAEYQLLLKRAQVFAERKKGVQRDGAYDLPRSPGFENMHVEIPSVMVIDLDGDGKNDMILQMRAPPQQKNNSGIGIHRSVWAGVGLIFANGEEEQLSKVYSSSNYWIVTKAGHIPGSPLAVLRMTSCNYLVYRPSEAYGAISFRAFGKVSDGCKDRYAMKFLETWMLK